MQAYATPETGLSSQLRLVGSESPALATRVLEPGRDAFDQLLARLAELVADRVAAQLAAPQRATKDEWLDTRRSAEYLGISRDTVRRLAAEGSIPTEQAGSGASCTSGALRWTSGAALA